MEQSPPYSCVSGEGAAAVLRRRSVRSVGQRVLCFAILVVAIFPLWYQLGSHPLYPHSEGRYASVSKEMLLHDHWLVPEYQGQMHLTKPPLAYWAQAGCMKIFGFNEWSCRLPSALAGTLVLIILFVLGWQIANLRLAALATGILGMMPLFVVVSRLTLTDSLLNLFWFGAMAAGFMAVGLPKGKKRLFFVTALWIAVALGWMTKGPLALVPVGVLFIWLMLSGRWREIKKLKPVAGLVLSALPISAWVVLVVIGEDQAWHIWYMQIIGRAVGSGDHPQPIWYFLPIFLGGLFPATAMLYLPGANYSWRRVWPMLRSGSSGVYWGLQVVLPFIMFTLIKGKLATYILPLCAPLALITGQMLLQWLDGKHDNPKAPLHPGVKPPEVVATFFISLAIAGVVIVILLGYFFGLIAVLELVALAPVILAAAWLWKIWKTWPKRRTVGLAAVFFTYVLSLAVAGELVRHVLSPSSTKALISVIEKKLDSKPLIVTYGYDDSTLSFYYANWAKVKNKAELKQYLAKHGQQMVVIVHTFRWAELQKNDPQLASSFKRLFSWKGSVVSDDRLVLERK